MTYTGKGSSRGFSLPWFSEPIAMGTYFPVILEPGGAGIP